ncbi:MAG: carboxypeptidase-like regulatory domain-containing protein [Planctomycetota bacterium]
MLVAGLLATGLLAWLWASAAPGDAPQAIPGAHAARHEATVAPPESASIAAAPRAGARVTPDERTPAAPGLGAFVGRVVGPDGRPLAAATVQCTGEPERAATTGPDGKFRLRAPAPCPRNVRIEARARGYRQLSRVAPRPAGDRDFTVGDLVLKPGATVRGRVFDAAGRPVAEAWVEQLPPDDRQGMGNIDLGATPTAAQDGLAAQTDIEGHFALPHAAPGALALKATHPEHPPVTVTLDPLEAGATRAGIEIRFAAAGSITGTALGVPTGHRRVRVVAAAQATSPDAPPEAVDPADLDVLRRRSAMQQLARAVGLGDRSTAVSAVDGSFELRGLREGATYELWLVEADEPRPGGPPTTPERCSSSRPAQASTRGVELRYHAGIQVSLRAIDDGSQQPVEDLELTWHLSGAADAVGEALLRHPPRQAHYPGGLVTLPALRPADGQRLHIKLQAVGFQPWLRGEIELPLSGALDLGTVRLSAAPVVQVRLLDHASGAPIAGAMVRLIGRPPTRGDDRGPRKLQRATSDDTGLCRFNSLPGGEGQLLVQSDTHATWRGEAFAMPERGDVQREVPLVRGGDVTVTVVDVAGAPAAQVAIERHGPDAGSEWRETDASGQIQFARLVPGQHWFKVQPDPSMAGAAPPGPTTAHQPTSPWQAVRVIDGAAAALQLVRPALGDLRGTLSADGRTLAGATLALQLTDAAGVQQNRPGRADDRGQFHFRHLPVGTHRLVVAHPTLSLPAILDLEIATGAQDRDLRIRTVQLTGTVVDQDGAPLAGARLRARRSPTATAAKASPGRPPRTGADGRFALRVPPPLGEVALEATAAERVPASVRLPLGAGAESIDAGELRLVRAGRIRIEVGEGSATAPRSAEAVRTGDEAPSARARAEFHRGVAVLAGLHPGSWTVEVTVTDGRQGTTVQRHRVEVTAGTTTHLVTDP